jgi:translation initiation factor 2 gamma subunit (eIF-2gamma)
MSTLSQFGSGIKSIQRGTLSNSVGSQATATISPVNTSKALLSNLGTSGYDFANTTLDGAANYRLTLTNSTTITANRGVSTSNNIVVSWELVEYY